MHVRTRWFCLSGRSLRLHSQTLMIVLKSVLCFDSCCCRGNWQHRRTPPPPTPPPSSTTSHHQDSNTPSADMFVLCFCLINAGAETHFSTKPLWTFHFSNVASEQQRNTKQRKNTTISRCHGAIKPRSTVQNIHLSFCFKESKKRCSLRLLTNDWT